MGIFGIFFFFFGLILGSFANVLILRFNTGAPIANSRSKCFSCGKKLSWRELIPVGSFLMQRGRCRQCWSKISWQYPAVELALGFLFLFFFLKWRMEYAAFSDIAVLALWCAAGFLLLVLSVYDFRHKILPDRFSYAFMAVGLLAGKLVSPRDFILSLTPALFLAGLWFFSRGKWMGLGDAKLMIGGGIFLGWPGALSAVFFGFWAASLAALALLALSRSVTLKSEIPFGPFLTLGILIAFFFPVLLNPLLSLL